MSTKIKSSTDAIFSIEVMTLSTVMLMAVVILSCSKKSDASDEATAAETPQNYIQFADDSEFKNFAGQGIIPLNNQTSYQEYLKERYGQSCLIRRNSRGDIVAYREIGGFDESLNINEKVIYSLHTQNQSESKKTEQSIDVVNISDKFATIQTSILSIIIPQAGGEVLLMPINDQQECVWTGGNPAPFCNGNSRTIDYYRPFMTLQGFEFLKNAQHQSKRNCNLVGQTASLSTVEKGQFKLQNGASISAFKTTITESGTLMCNGLSMGVGEIKTMSIHSNDVKAVPGLEGFARGGNFSCGGTLVAETRVMKTPAGVIEAMRFEQKQPALK